MIRTLFIIAGAALVLSIATIGGAAALGSRDLAANGWSWTFTDDNGENVRFERVRGGGASDLGPVITRTLAWDAGQSLGIEAALTVEYIQGAEAGVVVTGPKGLADRVQLENGRLSLSEGDERVVFGWDRNGPTARSERDELRIVVTAPNINTFDMEGSGRLTLRDYDQDALSIDLSGSGDIFAAGRARTLELDISGSGEADLSQLTLADANVAIAGSGEARLGPNGRADVTISGSGDVELTQQPATLNQSVSGSGDIDVVSVRSERRISDTPPVTVSTTRSVEVTREG